MNRDELLRNVPFLHSLAPDDIAALAHKLEEIRLAPGARRSSRRGSGFELALFIIDKGEIQITYGRGRGRIELAMLKEGQYFGEMSLLDGAPRSACATAIAPAVLLRLEREDFLAYLHEDPEAAVLNGVTV